MAERVRRWVLAAAFVVLAGLGWWRHVLPLSVLGIVGALLVWLMYAWQHRCLDGVSYRRRLTTNRAIFGEVVFLETEVVNDKFLPLVWLEVEDQFPSSLSPTGVTPVDEPGSGRRYLVNVLPMLPFQRRRRRIAVTLDVRGRHVFGPGRLRSGDPVAYRTREEPIRARDVLLVYPKVFALEPPSALPQVLLGEQRARVLIGDPSRIAGVREYRSGDPLRNVDWRATARSSNLLVREHEPTASLRTAVLLDLSPNRLSDVESGELLEFTIAVAASVITALSEAGISVGLFGSGTAQSRPLLHVPSGSPETLGAILELLAEASPYGPESFAEVFADASAHLATTTSFLVVGSTYNERVRELMSVRRRRGPVSTVWIRPSDDAWPPELDASIQMFTATFREDWKHESTLELAS